MAEISVRSDDDQMIKAPARASQRAGRTDEKPQPESKPPRRRRGRKIVRLVAALLLIAGILAGAWFYEKHNNGAAQVDSSKYQALFLTNGQVYFGKLTTLNGNYYSLTDIFYLQTDSTSTDSKNPQNASDAASSDVKLIKLGSEVHGPEDQMVVNRDQVLFFENLKSDGRVSASIDQYLKK